VSGVLDRYTATRMTSLTRSPLEALEGVEWKPVTPGWAFEPIGNAGGLTPGELADTPAISSTRESISP
jgi:hypothetical protein